MPRKPAVTPNKHLHTTIPADLAARLDLPLWCIGGMVEGRAGEVTVFDPDHNPVEFPRRGYDHFG